MTPGSPFLDRPREEWVASNALAFAIRDAFPVSPGHTLVVPRRLIAGWFETTTEERQGLFELVDEVRKQLDAGPVPPEGYNIGVNVGDAAGQATLGPEPERQVQFLFAVQRLLSDGSF